MAFVDLQIAEEAAVLVRATEIACSPNAAFDSRLRRLLLVEPIDVSSGCRNGVFAVDMNNGAFTQIVPRLD